MWGYYDDTQDHLAALWESQAREAWGDDYFDHPGEPLDEDVPEQYPQEAITMDTLHARLRMLRQRAHLHLAEVAESADISVSFLSDLERGRTLPALDTLERIAAVYGLSVGELLVNVRIRQEF